MPSNVERSVLKEITPDRKETAQMGELSEKMVATAKRVSPHIRPMVCGSVEKGTWLRGRDELDLFLLFPTETSREDLEKKGLAMAKDIIGEMRGEFVIAFAEHPYLRGAVNYKGRKYKVDIVPCFDIKDPSRIKSAVDRTPHHVRYIKENLRDRGSVLLLKQFCKAAGCYGADMRVQGFSGYLCELIIVRYGSFEKAVKAMAKWEAGQRVSLSDSKEEFKAPLTLIDPVDPKRNVAAAVSAESFYKLVKAAKDYAAHPHKSFFKVDRAKPYTMKEVAKEIRTRRTRFYLVHFRKPDVLDDVLWPQLRRGLSQIERILGAGGFRVLRSDVFVDDGCIMLFEMDVWQVPRVKKQVGPSIYSRSSEGFLKKYKSKRAFIEKDAWVVEPMREHTTALAYLQSFFSQPADKLMSEGMPNKLAPMMKDVKIASGHDAIKLMSKQGDDFRVFLKGYFEKDLS